jgi:hypothetical protein
MICKGCKQDIKYHDLKRSGNELVCPICFHVHHTIKADAKEKFMESRIGKVATCSHCGGTDKPIVMNDGRCSSCKAKYMSEKNQEKRKAIIMDSKPRSAT